MQRIILLVPVAALLMSVAAACSSYNQEPSVTPSIVTPSVPAGQPAAGQSTRAPNASPAASAATPVQAAATPTAAPNTCPGAAAAVPASIPGVPAAPTDTKTVTTPSGLQYIDLVPGTGADPRSGQTATVDYTGWLLDGKKFDSSKDHGSSFSFPLGAGQVIKGWDEGVASMKVGGQRRLIVPPNLAYGPKGAGGVVPPCATLIFDVNLVGTR